MKNQTVVLSISQGKGCYRHIKISSNATLFELHTFILEIFDFFDDHLHVFFMNNRGWDEEYGYYSPHTEDVNKFSTDFRICDLPLEKGSKFLYIFDFGEEWRFSIKVLRIEETETKQPVVIKEVGEVPMQYPGLEEDDDDIFSIHNPFVPLSKPLTAKEKNRATLLNQYALAAVNLYGIITKNEFIQIFNSQNNEKTSIDEVFNTLLQYIHDYAGYCFYEEYIVHESFEENDFALVLDLEKAIASKPRFIPGKDEFLKFADEGYTDKPIHFARVRKFLEDTFGETENVHGLYMDIKVACANNEEMGHILDLFEMHGLPLQSLEKAQVFAGLIMEAMNNTRIWLNKGYTPTELAAYEKLKPINNRKIGRNEPCPCGSGKKYKKCCGR